jgi:acyl-CoA thioesterase I
MAAGGGPPLVLFFGDSFVAGAGNPECRGWVGRVAEAAWEAGVPLTAYNLGVRREPSTEVVARLEPEARPRFAPGAECRVVFSFGANDATLEDGRPRVAPAEAVAALERALAEAADLGLPAFVVGPPPANDDAQIERIAELSARFDATCSAGGVPFIEVVAALRRSGPWLREARAGDGAHPGAGGYAQLTELVRRPFLRWLGATTRPGAPPPPGRSARRCP